MNDAFIQSLYEDMTSLYRLDQIQTGVNPEAEEESAEAEPLPRASKALLGLLAGIWILMGCYKLAEAKKAKKKRAK